MGADPDGMLVEWITDIGSRKDNQDSIGVASSENGRRKELTTVAEGACEIRGGTLCAVVADGVGGVPRGAEASTAAVKSILNTVMASEVLEEDLVILEDLVRFAIHVADVDVRDLEGPMTTVVVAIVANGFAAVGHSGDSRCYAMGESLSRTRDHSLGEMTGAETRTAADRSLVSCLGGSGCVVDTWTIGSDWSTILLTTDGCHERTSDPEMENLIRRPLRALVDDSRARGVTDNASAIRLTRQ